MNHYVLKRMAMAGAAAFSNKIECPFRYANWRTGYRWRPQKTQKEADEVQGTGNPSILGNRKCYERKTLPLSAAVCAYAGIARGEVEHTLRSYDYSQINLMRVLPRRGRRLQPSPGIARRQGRYRHRPQAVKANEIRASAGQLHSYGMVVSQYGMVVSQNV